MVSRILCFSLVIVVANAATWMGYLPQKPKELAHKEGCYVKEIGDVIPFGETVAPIGICQTIECSSRMLYYASCGAIGTTDPKCVKTDYDLSRPYPDCCPRIECEIDNRLD
ncbi:single domain von willebrand factor type C domain-containing protein [Phthorimaea operculella]|nr:single domain von willebrand factor type C domain-containing protein [Phthorimaea operculella]KAI5643215.1 single domain von willebrand factor type C domain-containing protein [Phthorimaea operculella]